MVDIRNLGKDAESLEDQINEYEKQGYTFIQLFIVRSGGSYAGIFRR